jgi:hypothetical protein
MQLWLSITNPLAMLYQKEIKNKEVNRGLRSRD